MYFFMYLVCKYFIYWYKLLNYCKNYINGAPDWKTKLHEFFTHYLETLEKTSIRLTDGMYSSKSRNEIVFLKYDSIKKIFIWQLLCLQFAFITNVLIFSQK